LISRIPDNKRAQATLSDIGVSGENQWEAASSQRRVLQRRTTKGSPGAAIAIQLYQEKMLWMCFSL
jgi:hypothetical protein